MLWDDFKDPDLFPFFLFQIFHTDWLKTWIWFCWSVCSRMIDGGQIPASLTAKGTVIYQWNGTNLQQFQSLDKVQSIPAITGAWNRWLWWFDTKPKKCWHSNISRTDLVGPTDIEYFEWDGEHYLVLVQVRQFYLLSWVIWCFGFFGCVSIQQSRFWMLECSLPLLDGLSKPFLRMNLGAAMILRLLHQKDWSAIHQCSLRLGLFA